ncbi:O-antigen translocase, partial [Arthrobacter sp. TPD3018]
MSLLKTSALNGVAVVVRTGTALVLNKVLAIYVGPAGYALIGQFQNALTMAITFATGATGNGVVKLTAEYVTDGERQRRMWRTAGLLVLGASIVGAALILAFRDQLASAFLHDPGYAGVFVWLAACLPLIAGNALLLAIMNGKKEVRRFVTSNIGGSIVSLLVT